MYEDNKMKKSWKDSNLLKESKNKYKIIYVKDTFYRGHMDVNGYSDVLYDKDEGIDYCHFENVIFDSKEEAIQAFKDYILRKETDFKFRNGTFSIEDDEKYNPYIYVEAKVYAKERGYFPYVVNSWICTIEKI